MPQLVECCFQYQRSAARIQSLAKFILNICLLSTALKRQKCRKSGREWPFKKECITQQCTRFLFVRVRPKNWADCIFDMFHLSKSAACLSVTLWCFLQSQMWNISFFSVQCPSRRLLLQRVELRKLVWLMMICLKKARAVYRWIYWKYVNQIVWSKTSQIKFKYLMIFSQWKRWSLLHRNYWSFLIIWH